jgi:hypothetical protein
MKRTHSLFEQHVAYILLVSLCLQSCGSGFGNNPIMPIDEKQIVSTQTNVQAIIPRADIQPLMGQTVTAQGGHTVTLYKEAGKLKANVKMNAPQGFSKTYEGLSVAVEKGAELAKLPGLDVKAQECRIHFQIATVSHPAKVVIYKGAGLQGGGNIPSKIDHTVDMSDQDNTVVNIPELPLEIWEQILSYVKYPHIVYCKSVNTFFHTLITGDNNIELFGLDRRPNLTYQAGTWKIEKEINFNTLWLKRLKPKRFSRFIFYQLLRNVKDLPIAYWPYLKDTQISRLNFSTSTWTQAIAPEFFILRHKEVVNLTEQLKDTKVDTLDLSGNKLGDAYQASNIVDMIRTRGRLREIVQNLPKTRIYTFILNLNELSDKNIMDIAEILPQTSIHRLDLNHNAIGDEGLEALAQVLPQSSIHILNLSNNRIGNKGAKALIQALAQSQLNTLDLSRNNIEKETQALLEQQYPHIKWTF